MASNNTNHQQQSHRPKTAFSSSSPYHNTPQEQQQRADSSSQQHKGSDASASISPSCRSCVRLITEILQNPDSRPRQVLQALASAGTGTGTGTHHWSTTTTTTTTTTTNSSTESNTDFHMEPLPDGVQVQMRLPESRHRLPQRWTRITPPLSSSSSTSEEEEQLSLQERVSSTFRPQPLATSADTVATATTSSSLINTADDSNGAAKPTTYTTETIKIECRKCDTVGPEKGARALIMGPTPLSIVACTNRLSLDTSTTSAAAKKEMAEVLTHELLHAYDVKRLSLDFRDCESMAYSEVRAAREAECANWNMMKEYCVNQKAIAATHNLFPANGRNCVRQVFAHAYADTRPFASNKNNQTK